MDILKCSETLHYNMSIFVIPMLSNHDMTCIFEIIVTDMNMDINLEVCLVSYFSFFLVSVEHFNPLSIKVSQSDCGDVVFFFFEGY